jgi:hypothetical protein
MALRALGLLLMVLVSVGGAMPAYARLVGGPHAHACNCEVVGGHAHCACPLCFPELNDVETFGGPAMTGRCGVDDPGWRTLSSPAVPTSPFVLVALLVGVEQPRSLPLAPTQWADRPELPPPRA